MGMRACYEKEKLYAQDLTGLTLGKAVEYAENVATARAAATASASGAGAAAAAAGAATLDPLLKISRSTSAHKGQAAAKSSRLAKPKCTTCGYTNHKTAECQYSDYVCKKCNVKGHLRRVCPSKVNYVDNGADDEDFGDDVLTGQY
ncbi:uncharacterized protein LOC125242330 [Leguminivora glycinivorella]|nr:uncharacterized protein LOC125242330 [Leguminivora glycinivorella]